MAVKVFVLGRPGSGKSSAARRIVKLTRRRGYSAIRINDYDILKEMFEADTEGKQFGSTLFGGFDVRDFSVLDTALRKANEKLRKRMHSADVIVIEFARDDYSKALEKFNRTFLKDAYILYLDTETETCIQRIHNRVTHPTTWDDHFVSPAILRRYYCNQCIPSNLTVEYGIAGEKIKVINNNGSRDKFDKNINRFVHFMYERDGVNLIGKSSEQNVTTRINRTIHVIYQKACSSVSRDSLQNIAQRIYETFNGIRRKKHIPVPLEIQRS